MAEPDKQSAPGWYEFEGGFRYWDGGVWTDQFGPPHPPRMSWVRVASAVAIGVIVAWALILTATKAAPDAFSVPVKVEVKSFSF
jgi:hypothetical protein